jgi:putative membrane protein
MTFTDDLTLVLDLLILVACVTFYTGFLIWLNVRQKDLPRAQSSLRMGATLLGGLGAVLGVIALWGEFTWPLALSFGSGNALASYDLLFFDSLTLLALVLVSFGVAVNLRLPTHFVGMLAVVCGFGVMYYGYRAYTLSLTLEPLETLLLFLGFGAAAVLSYPATLYLDWFVVGPTRPEASPLRSDPTPRYPRMWNLLLGTFLLLVVLAGIAALFYGFDTAWAHLAAPP